MAPSFRYHLMSVCELVTQWQTVQFLERSRKLSITMSVTANHRPLSVLGQPPCLCTCVPVFPFKQHFAEKYILW